MSERLRPFLEEHIAVARSLEPLLPQVEAIGDAICAAFAGGHRLYTFGNGGSATDAQHFAEEQVGRYRRERRPLPAVALTTDGAALTCIGNDYAFADIFSRQLTALANPGDVCVGISTSGNSENVVRGLEAAKARGAVTVALTGEGGGRAAEVADHAVRVPSRATARIQEMHILVIHMICEQIDEWAIGSEGG